MNKESVIQELNEINKQLAKKLDECTRGQKKLLYDLSKMCVRDVTPLNSYAFNQESEREIGKLTFSKSFGNASAIEENREHEFARKHTLVHLKSNSICTWIPKNSCSTLRFSIAVSNGAISGKEQIDWIHKNNASFRASNKELLNAEYTFVVLRNPFKRLLSFYCDKLCHEGEDPNDTSYETAKSMMGTTAKTTFAEFIDTLWQNPTLKKRNGHLRDQCDFLVYKDYHDYFSVERHDELAATILARTGVTLEDIRPFNSIHTTYGCEESIDLNHDMPAELIGSAIKKSKKPLAQNMYTPDLIRKVGSLYLSDILLYLKVIKNSEEEMQYWLSHMT